MLVKLPRGEAAPPVLPPQAFGLVVAATALIHPGRTRLGAGSEVGDGIRILAMLADALQWAGIGFLGRHALLAGKGMRISAGRRGCS